MSMVGEVTYFLCFQVKQMKDDIFSHSKYATDIAKKYGMKNVRKKCTPIVTHVKLSKYEQGVTIDQSLYRSMIGSLLYLTASRPNITLFVDVCHTLNLTMNHWFCTFIIVVTSLYIISCILYHIMPRMSVKINFRIYRQTGWINFQICVKSEDGKFPNQACRHQFY